MTVAEHGREHEFDDVALAEHGALHVVGELAERLREPGRLLLRDRHALSSVVVGRWGMPRLRGGRRGRGGRGGQVRVARGGERRRRGVQAPAFRIPVRRDRDPLDAHGAERHSPGVRAGRGSTLLFASMKRRLALPKVITAPLSADEVPAATRSEPPTQLVTRQLACTWYGALPARGYIHPGRGSPQYWWTYRTRMPGSRPMVEVAGARPGTRRC